MTDKEFMKRAAVIFVNSVLVLVIAGLILATWLPAIYTSQWFQRNRLVGTHLLSDADAVGNAQPNTERP